MLRRALLAASITIVGFVAPGSAPAADEPVESSNISHVANLPWGDEGTDLEFATLAGRDFAVAGTYYDGLKLVDITDPTTPRLVSSYPCGIAQGDVQVFNRAGRTYATYTSDDGYSPRVDTACFADAKVAKGKRYGTFIIDITDPTAPRAISFLAVTRGSHNTTVHPSGRYLYNSNADIDTSIGVIEVIDISDLSTPKQIAALDLVTGMSAHDITFSADGTRAYAAALTHTVIIDTTDAANPTVVGRIVDPAVNIHHGADPFHTYDPESGAHTYLIVSDELAGAAGNFTCPGGGLHVYDITGVLEQAPLKIGVYFIPDVRVTEGESIRCTSHVMQVHQQQELMTIGWYAAGVHVLDLSPLVTRTVEDDPAELLGAGIRSVGSIRFADSETWAAKTNRIAPDGSFHLYGNDVLRGFDVYRYVPGPAADPLSPLAGTWSAPDGVPAVDRLPGYEPRCLVAL